MAPTKDYSFVNGIKMYYELHGEGKPLVLLHGGGSVIETSFAFIIPILSKKRQIIAMDLQAHGRTEDRSTPLSFKQDADDVAGLLQNLGIKKADFLGFSNGGQTCIEIGLRHPGIVNKLILASAFYKRSGVAPQFWEGFASATIDQMPQELKEGFLKVNNDQNKLLNMFNRDVERMKSFTDWTDGQMRSLNMPVLIINTSKDVGSPEHALEMYRLLPNAEIVILPGFHGSYLNEEYIVSIMEGFLK
jgi:pimeloyl-ACP methyl ester carboxylesterase